MYSQAVCSRVDGLNERTLAIQQDVYQSVLFPIGVFDTAFALSKLSVVALLARDEVRRSKRGKCE